MDNTQKDGSQAPQGIADSQAPDSELDENSSLGSGDRGPAGALGSGDRGPAGALGSGDR